MNTNTRIIIRHSKKLTINYPQFSLDTRIIKITLMILHANIGVQHNTQGMA